MIAYVEQPKREPRASAGSSSEGDEGGSVSGRAARCFGRVAWSARDNSALSSGDDSPSCSARSVSGISLLLPRAYGVWMGGDPDIPDRSVRLLPLRGIRGGGGGGSRTRCGSHH